MDGSLPTEAMVALKLTAVPPENVPCIFRTRPLIRGTGGLRKIPVDAAVVAIVDTVDVLGKKLYGKSSS